MSRRRELVILVAAAVLVAAAAYLLLIRPKAGEVGTAQADRRRAMDEAQVLRTQIKALEDVRADAAALRTRANAARNLFPGTPDLPDLVDALQRVADQSGAVLVSVQPSPPVMSTTTPQLASIGTAVSVRGGYFQIEDFLARLEGLVKSPDPASRIPPRSVIVQAVNIGPGSGGQGSAGGASASGGTAAAADQLTANVNLVAFQTAKQSGTGAGAGAPTTAAGSGTQ